MYNIKSIKQLISAHKSYLRDKYCVSEIGVFGSYVRNEQDKNSDIDILVSFSKPIGLFAFTGLKIYLSKLLDRKVDLVMKTSLKPVIGKNILKEVQYA